MIIRSRLGRARIETSVYSHRRITRSGRRAATTGETSMNNTTQPPSGKPRKFITRVLAGAALLTMYGLGMIATTGAAMTMAATPAHAQRGRGRGWGGGPRGRGRGWGGPGVGAAVGIGIGAAIVGGAIAASQAEAARQQDYCARRFRSYNPATGTYIGRDGIERPCP
jgi:hypothetical protein